MNCLFGNVCFISRIGIYNILWGKIYSPFYGIYPRCLIGMVLHNRQFCLLCLFVFSSFSFFFVIVLSVLHYPLCIFYLSSSFILYLLILKCMTQNQGRNYRITDMLSFNLPYAKLKLLYSLNHFRVCFFQFSI